MKSLVVDLVAQELLKRGLSVERSKSISGVSGVEHVFDVVGVKDGEVVLAVDCLEGLADQTSIVSLWLKLFDTEISKYVLVVAGEISSEAERMIEELKINVLSFSADDVDGFSRSFEKLLEVL
ncbi:MAG: hypothetical protein DRJ68_05595 [Thermoprotei archaeon]|nr:MAG: hypothetical protein DRJ68_05595 [Thermoprotei archaeon]